MYSLQPAEKRFILKVKASFPSFNCRKKSLFLFVQRISSLFSRRIWTLFLLVPFALRRQDKWYVIVHFGIWHFQFDNIDVFRQVKHHDIKHFNCTCDQRPNIHCLSSRKESQQQERALFPSSCIFFY